MVALLLPDLRQHPRHMSAPARRVGARHLAPSGDGPAAHWRAFTAGLDAVLLSSEEEARAVDGANAAFSRVQSLANAALR